MKRKRIRVRVKKHRRELVKKKKVGPIVFCYVYMVFIALIASAMISACPSQYFIVEANGPQAQKGEKMRVTIFAGQGSFEFHAMEGLKLLHENGNEYPVNAKDVDKGMQIQLDGKFRRVVRVCC